MKRALFFLLVFFSFQCFSQNAPDWDYPYGGSQNDYSYDVIETSNGDYVMVGYTSSEGAGGSDIYLIRTDNIGTTIWTRTFGGPDDERAFSVDQASDGGFIIAGNTVSYAAGNSDRDIWLIKTDDQGYLEWDATYGEGGGSCVQQTLDGGYILGGSKLIKTDANGVVEWSYETSCSSVMQTDDEGYIILGSYLHEDIILTKRFADGSEDWTMTFPGDNLDFPGTVRQTFDGGYILCGTSNVVSGEPLDAWLKKTDGSGNLIWSERYGGPFHDEGHDVKQTIDGGYILVGLTQELDVFDNDLWVIKIDAQGSQQWQYTANSPANNALEAVHQTSDNGYIMTGNNSAIGSGEYDMWLVHFPPDPLTAWFTATPTVVGTGGSVNFYDGSLGGGPDTWQWTFHGGASDPATSNVENPVVTYDAEGTYDVSLTITKDGSSNSITRTGYIVVTDNQPLTYCNSNGDATSKWIESITLNEQTNSSGSSGDIGYEDYTSIVFELVSGESYNITLDPGQNPGKKVQKWWRVWMDLNLDGDFTIDEVVFGADAEKGSVSGFITLPPDIVVETRMRISMSTDGVPLPCGTGFIGEVEDYTINITPPIPQPPVADFEGEPTYVATGIPVSFTDLSTNNPTSWLWVFQIGEGETDILQSTEQNPTISYPNTGVFDVTLTAYNSVGSDSETKVGYIIVSNSPPPIQYCEPENIQNDILTHIRKIVVNNIEHETLMGISGYMYYSNFQTFTFVPGGTYGVELTPGDSRARNFWRIWVDINGNGDFYDEGELLFSANNKKGTVTGDIDIPVNANAPGLTRMRISMKRGSSQSDPCEDDFEGEVEDYNVEFDFGSRSSLADNLSDAIIADIYPNPVSTDMIALRIDNDSQPVTIRVINSIGSEIYRVEGVKDVISINTSTYPKGIYFIQINSGEASTVKKFLKM